MPRLRPVLAGATGWLIGATASVGVGLLALSMVGVGPAEQPLQPQTLNAPVVTTPSPTVTASPSPRARPTSSTTSTQRVLSSDGGTVVARCAGDQAYLVYWTPAQGYHVDDVARGPRRVASVTFETGREQHVRIEVTCVHSVPTAEVRTGSDD
jgi:hypothetical protein